jgi:hypothetical protein
MIATTKQLIKQQSRLGWLDEQYQRIRKLERDVTVLAAIAAAEAVALLMFAYLLAIAKHTTG